MIDTSRTHYAIVTYCSYNLCTDIITRSSVCVPIFLLLFFIRRFSFMNGPNDIARTLRTLNSDINC